MKRGIQFGLQAIILIPLFGLISLLPFFVLYIISDILYIIFYHIFKYRRSVVRDNLKKAFPRKSEADIINVERKFYRHLCDMTLETIKLFTISGKTLNARCYIPPELNVYPELYEKYGSVISVLGHYGNWEMICQASTTMAPHRILVIYKPLSNPFFEWFFKYIRTRTGAEVVSMRDSYRKFLKLKDERMMPVMLTDQSPSEMNGAIWLPFMGRQTPVMNGVAGISIKLNLPVVVNSVKKVKRGVYEIVPKVLVSHPKGFSEREITKMHTDWLEGEIQNNPEWWLWSHRRWKHAPPKNIN